MRGGFCLSLRKCFGMGRGRCRRWVVAYQESFVIPIVFELSAYNEGTVVLFKSISMT